MGKKRGKDEDLRAGRGKSAPVCEANGPFDRDEGTQVICYAKERRTEKTNVSGLRAKGRPQKGNGKIMKLKSADMK